MTSTQTTNERSLKAKDIMVGEPVCVERTTTLRQLARLLDDNEISGAPVVDHEGRLVGVVSRVDLIRRCCEGTLDIPPADLFAALGDSDIEYDELASESPIYVETFMSEDPVTATTETSASEIARLMVANRFHRVMVVDDDRFPIGIITSLDLLGSYPGSGQ